MTRLLVYGGRDFRAKAVVYTALDRIHQAQGLTLVIEGGCPTGADAFARQWARDRGVPNRTFPADWRTYGKKAGPIRNAQMISEGQPDRGLGFPGGSGTADMDAKLMRAAIPRDRVFEAKHP